MRLTFGTVRDHGTMFLGPTRLFPHSDRLDWL